MKNIKKYMRMVTMEEEKCPDILQKIIKMFKIAR